MKYSGTTMKCPEARNARLRELAGAIIVLLVLSICSLAHADDLPTRLHDVYRSGVTPERIYPPLTRAWVFTTKRGPLPAWTESPAVHDYLHNWYDLKPRQNF